MDLSSVICDCGASAIFEARKICSLTHDNEVREEFISALMCTNLHQSLEKPVRSEVPYTKIYGELSTAIPADSATKIGDLRADIAVYDTSPMRPIAIVEIKKFAENATADGIVSDLRKADSVELNKYVQIYSGVFVCETNQYLPERVELLKKSAPDYHLQFSDAHQSLNGGWRWCFACISHSKY
jgi:hypothetical protein